MADATPAWLLSLKTTREQLLRLEGRLDDADARLDWILIEGPADHESPEFQVCREHIARGYTPHGGYRENFDRERITAENRERLKSHITGWQSPESPDRFVWLYSSESNSRSSRMCELATVAGSLLLEAPESVFKAIAPARLKDRSRWRTLRVGNDHFASLKCNPEDDQEPFFIDRPHWNQFDLWASSLFSIAWTCNPELMFSASRDIFAPDGAWFGLLPGQIPADVWPDVQKGVREARELDPPSCWFSVLRNVPGAAANLIDWIERATDRGGVAGDYLGIEIDSDKRLIRRAGCDIPVDLSGSSKLWELFVALHEKHGSELTADERSKLSGEASGHKRLADRLRDSLKPLGLTVSDFRLLDDGNTEVTQR